MMTVEEYAQGVADSIEKNGHYQGSFEEKGTGAVCLVCNDIVTPDKQKVAEALYWAITPLVLEQGWEVFDEKGLKALGRLTSVDLFRWNDATSTEKVLDTLRSIA